MTRRVRIPDDVPPFHRAVYETLCAVPRGRVTTYGDLAHAMGTNAYRAVGQALRCNPCAPHVPCHRVIASDGRIGGFNGATAGTQIARKIRLLADEGVVTQHGRIDLDRFRHRFA